MWQIQTDPGRGSHTSEKHRQVNHSYHSRFKSVAHSRKSRGPRGSRGPGSTFANARSTPGEVARTPRAFAHSATTSTHLVTRGPWQRASFVIIKSHLPGNEVSLDKFIMPLGDGATSFFPNLLPQTTGCIVSFLRL